MLDRDLPWEASQPCLELLRSYRDNEVGMPTIRLARWFWRITLAAPDWELSQRIRAAQMLSQWEMDAGRSETPLRSIEGYLTYRPWQSIQNRDAYEKAVSAKRNPLPSYEKKAGQLSVPADEHSIQEWATGIEWQMKERGRWTKQVLDPMLGDEEKNRRKVRGRKRKEPRP